MTLPISKIYKRWKNIQNFTPNNISKRQNLSRTMMEVLYSHLDFKYKEGSNLTQTFMISLSNMVAGDVLSCCIAYYYQIFAYWRWEDSWYPSWCSNTVWGSVFHILLCSKGANDSKLAMRICIKHAACNTRCHSSELS